jgi:acyl carrier protein
MVPSAFVVLGDLPLTASGKVDRRSLPPRGTARREREEAYAGPSTAVEQTIADVWREVLDVEQVGINLNFFDLGGDSLLVIRLRSRLGKLLNMEIPIIELFRYPTVRSLAQFLTVGEVKTNSFQTVQERARKQIEAVDQLRRQMSWGAGTNE